MNSTDTLSACLRSLRHREQRSAAVLGRSKREVQHLSVEAAGSAVVASRLITSIINKQGGYRPYRKLAGRLAHLTRKDGET